MKRSVISLIALLSAAPVTAQQEYKSVGVTDFSNLNEACKSLSYSLQVLFDKEVPMTRNHVDKIQHDAAVVNQQLSQLQVQNPGKTTFRCMIVESAQPGSYVCAILPFVGLAIVKPSIPLFHGDWLEVKIESSPFRISTKDGNNYMVMQDSIFKKRVFEDVTGMCYVMFQPSSARFQVFKP